MAFLGLLEEKYGGVENYVKYNLGFSADDVTTIRRNVLLGAKL